MKHTALAFILTASLLLGGCNNLPTEQTAMNDSKSTLSQTEKESMMKEIEKEQAAMKEKQIAQTQEGDDKNATEEQKPLKSKTYEDPKTGWMVYESEEEGLKFKFEYPKDFGLTQYNQLINRIDYIERYLVSIGKNYDEGPDNPARKGIGITISTTNKNQAGFNEWFKKLTEFKGGYNNKCGEQKVFIDTKKQLNGFQLIKREISCPKPIEGYSGFFKQVFLEDKNNVWIIDAMIIDPLKNETEKIFNQVVDSFTLL